MSTRFTYNDQKVEMSEWHTEINKKKKQHQDYHLISIRIPYSSKKFLCLNEIPYDISSRYFKPQCNFCEYFGVRVEWNVYL